MTTTRVVNVSNLPVQAQEIDLLETFSRFGHINYVQLGDPGLAEVEFEDPTSAQKCLTMAVQGGGLFMLGQPLYLSASQAQNIPRMKLESIRPTNCLVIHVKNLRDKAINVKVIRAVCEKVAQCIRIAIHREPDDTFALVEFASSDIAQSVKRKLNGANIYTGACNLKIEFAKLTFVKVKGDNPQDNWDGSVSNGGLFGMPPRERVGILDGDASGMEVDEDDVSGYGAGPGAVKGAGRAGIRSLFDVSNGISFDPNASSLQQLAKYGAPPGGARAVGRGYAFAQGSSGAAYRPAYPMPPGLMMHAATADYADGTGRDLAGGVVIGFGFAERLNCEHIFNIFCLYGNVARVMFLRSKPHACLIQMGDSVAARRVLDHLARFKLFGKTVTVRSSAQDFVSPVKQPAERSDGTSTYRDFTNGRDNRFVNAKTAAKNRLPAVSQTLYFFNCPVHFTPDDVTAMFTNAGATAPRVQIFPNKQSEDTKVCSGLAEFADEESAMNALALTNNTKIEREDSKFPFVFKLSFMSDRSDRRGAPEGYFPMMTMPGGSGFSHGDGGYDGMDFELALQQIPIAPPRGGGDDFDFGMAAMYGAALRRGGGVMRGVRTGRVSKTGGRGRGRGRGGITRQ